MRILAFTLVASVGLTSVMPARLLAQDSTPAADGALTVSTGKLTGAIVDLDGKTPIGAAKVQILDADGKVVAEATTDDAGTFQLGEPAAGSYKLVVGQVSGRLVVKEGAPAHSLRLVLDKAIALGTAKAAGAQKLEAISTTGVVLLVVGAAIVGTGAGIGIGYAVWGSQGTRTVFVRVSP